MRWRTGRERERTREREKSSHVQNTREGLIGQIMESVHGVTTEEVHAALQRCDWNPLRAEQQLKMPFFSISIHISAPLQGSPQHLGHGDLIPERGLRGQESLDDSGSWRTNPVREKHGSNLQKMAGLSQSLESVLGGPRPRANTGGMIRVDQHGRLMTPMMAAHNALMQQDTRRFSEASINPPPRRPPPNLKRLNIKSQRRPMLPLPGASRPTQLILPPPPQPPAQQPPQPQPGSNLAKMAHLARSTPQLNEVDNREGERENQGT
ncbi:unnamed protein product [Pleuronectes platessa]|uniref:Uncharacterized protein n=1 Tax=Pleuronectes platessa TaxID=8262 RepID=A0A9N7Y7U7_PLEPL|nr:unnamed protein product [Pleuronectes platessa]